MRAKTAESSFWSRNFVKLDVDQNFNFATCDLSTFLRNFSPAGKARFVLARISQSAGVPNCLARRIISMMSASGSATYTSRVVSMSAAISAIRFAHSPRSSACNVTPVTVIVVAWRIVGYMPVRVQPASARLMQPRLLYRKLKAGDPQKLIINQGELVGTGFVLSLHTCVIFRSLNAQSCAWVAILI